MASVVFKMAGNDSSGAWTSNGGNGLPGVTTWSMPAQVWRMPAKLGGAAEQHGAAMLFDERRIANELQGVAQALLGMEQDRSGRPGARPASAAARKSWAASWAAASASRTRPSRRS